MTADTLKTTRVLELYQDFLSGKLINKQQAAEQYHVNVRSIQRDIDSIRDFLSEQCAKEGIVRKIEYDKKENGYRLVTQEIEQLSKGEVLALCKILLESRAFTKEQVEKQLQIILNLCVSQKEKSDIEFLSSSSIWCHPVISSDIWFPLCKGKIHASTNNNLKYPRFFDAFFLYSVFSVWTAQMEIGGMFRRDAGQNAPLLRHKTKGKSRIMNQNQAKEYYKKLFVNYPDVLSVEEATTLLGFKSQTAIIRRIHQHRIRCLKVGRSFMIPKEYLIDYLLDS